MSGRQDAPLALTWFALLAFGVVMVASASAAVGAVAVQARHAVFLLAALFTFAAILSVPLRHWETAHRPCLFLALILLAVVLAPGIGREVNGAQRWIGLGGFTLQPSEIAKFLVTIYLAGYLARAGRAVGEDALTFLRPLLWVGAVLALLMLEPDFGSAVVIAALTGGLMFLAGVRLRYFLAAAALAVAAFGALAVGEDYRLARLTSFLDPWAVAFDSGYQLTQALIPFGRGGWFGVGLGESAQKLHFLPEAHNDFIFAVVVEELGIAGAAALIALFVVLVLRLLTIARAAAGQGRAFAAFVTYGAALLLAAQALIHVGVNIGVLPTKGLTLPFVSFGGNSLIVCTALIALGLRAHWEGGHERR